MLEQLKKDIAGVQSHIVKLIQDNHLDGYSFYLYVLPFNDGLVEKESIIKDILNGGGVI